ncbi:MAG: YceI family protein [Pseudomonadota bacterium]
MRLLFVSALTLAVAACGSPETAEPVDAEAPDVSAEATSELPVFEGDFVWLLDKEASSVKFMGVEESGPFEGHFDTFDVAISLNPDDPSDAKIHAVIDIASYEANDETRNEYFPHKAWMNLEDHPTATFISESVTASDDGGFVASGDLTIKGFAKAIDLPFSLAIDGNTAMAQATLPVDRTEFKVGRGYTEDDVQHNVDVVLDIVATR